jgi:hypothetical protein
METAFGLVAGAVVSRYTFLWTIRALDALDAWRIARQR